MTRGQDVDEVLALEVVGPPGSGKTTLVDALTRPLERGGGAPGTRTSVYCNRRNLPAWLGAVPAAAPLAATQLGRMSPRELRWVLRLEASPAIVRRAGTAGSGAVVLDQGPVFTMVRLMAARTLRPWRATAAGWWEATLRRWAGALDLLVVLDAPDDVLLPRIDGRGKRHELKGATRTIARRELGAERARYEALADQLRQRGPLQVVRFDTSRLPPHEIGPRVLSALGVTGAGSS